MSDRQIHQLLRGRLRSHSSAPPVLSSLISKGDNEGVESIGKSFLKSFALLGAGVTGLLGFATMASADEAEHGLASPDYPWPHKGILSSYDHALEGLHYNPYFPGGAIAMPKMLNDDAVEYEDGIPATEAQMGKDVVTFLAWAAQPEMEERKLMRFKWIFVLSLALIQAAYYMRRFLSRESW